MFLSPEQNLTRHFVYCFLFNFFSFFRTLGECSPTRCVCCCFVLVTVIVCYNIHTLIELACTWIFFRLVIKIQIIIHKRIVYTNKDGQLNVKENECQETVIIIIIKLWMLTVLIATNYTSSVIHIILPSPSANSKSYTRRAARKGFSSHNR